MIETILRRHVVPCQKVAFAGLNDRAPEEVTRLAHASEEGGFPGCGDSDQHVTGRVGIARGAEDQISSPIRRRQSVLIEPAEHTGCDPANEISVLIEEGCRKW